MGVFSGHFLKRRLLLWLCGCVARGWERDGEKGPGLVASHSIFSCHRVSVPGLRKNDGGVRGKWTHMLFTPQSGKITRRVMKEKNHCLLCPRIATFFMFYYHVV